GVGGCDTRLVKWGGGGGGGGRRHKIGGPARLVGPADHFPPVNNTSRIEAVRDDDDDAPYGPPLTNSRRLLVQHGDGAVERVIDARRTFELVHLFEGSRELLRIGREVLRDFHLVIECQGGEGRITLHQFGEFQRGLSQGVHLVGPEAAGKVEREDHGERARERRFVVHCEEVYIPLLPVFEDLNLLGAQVADVIAKLVSGGHINHYQIGVHADSQS